MLNKEKILKRLEEHPEPKECTEMREHILKSFENLTFFEDGHRYEVKLENGQTLQLPSVSQIAGAYEREFDELTVSENYALKHGETPEYWRDEWKYKNLIATTTGTYVHEFGESLAWIRSGHPENICDCCKTKFNEEKWWLIPTREKEKAVVKFWDDIPDCYHVILPEAKIYNLDTTTQPYAGTFDLGIYYDCKENPEKNGFIIFDYKSNNSLYNEYNAENNKMLKNGFSDMVECPYSVYVLQLNLYQAALENIGIHVIDRRLIWLLPDGTYQLVKIPEIQERIKENF
ncbi:MAG: hypothetical protein J6X18_16985 [Bacteroidales bacterium]|nr:hypothetical protein [Bacteroidales bacterium]